MTVNVKDPGEAVRLSEALRLAKLGFRIAPLRPMTKLPYLGESWVHIATTDEAQIRSWFKSRPSMNYAVFPGAEYVVLDPDQKIGKDGIPKEGVFQLTCLELDVATLKVRTPSNGEHWYFKSPFPVGNSTKKLKEVAPDVDVRGAVGYVVGPGCYTAEDAERNTCEGVYEIVSEPGADIATLPANVVQYLEKSEPSDNKTKHPHIEIEDDGKRFADGVELDTEHRVAAAVDWLKRVAQPAIEGQQGDDKTFATFAHIREFHAISRRRAFDLVKEHFNPRCKPEWSNAELARICVNAYRYAQRPIKPDLMANHFDSEAQQPQSDDPGSPVTQKSSRYAGTMFNAAAPALLKFRPAELLIGSPGRPYLPAYGITNLLARKRTGKTVLQLYTGLAVATDTTWFGEKVMPGWYAIMQAGEVPELTLSHFLALLHSRGIEWPPRFIWSPIQDLTDPNDPDEFIRNVHALGVPKDARCLVMTDTFPRAIGGASQNDAEKMKAALVMLEYTTRKLNGCALPSYHPRKTGEAEKISGAGELENFTNGSWFAEKVGDVVQMKLLNSRLRSDESAKIRKFYSIENNSFPRPLPDNPEYIDEGGVVTPQKGPQPGLAGKTTVDLAIEAIEDAWSKGIRIDSNSSLAKEAVERANPGMPDSERVTGDFYKKAVETARKAIERACQPHRALHPYKIGEAFTVPKHLYATTRKNLDERKREAEHAAARLADDAADDHEVLADEGWD